MHIRIQITLFTLAFLLLSGKIHAQHWCGADEARKKAILENPDILDASEMLEQYTQEFIRARRESGDRDETVKIIPVVFHIIHMYGEENISDAQIYDAMEVLNRDFRKLNADTSEIVHGFDEIAADTRIEFRLARKDFFGNCTNGIDRIASIETFVGDDGSKLNQWPRNMYLNIWVVADMENGVAGYAYYPEAVIDPFAAKRDGIIIRHDYVGRIGTGSEYTSRALTHEIGHYLNLQHTWGNTNAPEVVCGDDMVEDTPETKGHLSCALDDVNCNMLQSYENVQNYMEYSYCSVMFTEGQKERMLATLNSPVAARSNLWSPANLELTGVLDNTASICVPQAEFYGYAEGNNNNPTIGLPIMVCVNDEVNFFDNTAAGTPTSWNWEFEDATPATSTEQNPVVTFNSPGKKSVTLTVSNDAGEDTRLYYQLVHVAWPWDVEGLLQENFEAANSFDPWISRNLDNNNTTWSRVNIAGSSGTSSVMLNALESEMSMIDSGDNDIDELVSPSLDLSLVDDAQFTFKYAYATKTTNPDEITETLVVYSSKDCGKTWTERLTLDGVDFVTAGAVNDYFIPGPNDWVEESFNIPVSLQSPNVRFKFVYTSSDASNNLYLDDINMTGVVGIENPEDELEIKLYPNPASVVVNISVSQLSPSDITIELLGSDGRIIQSMNKPAWTTDQPIVLDTSALSSGLYFVRVQSDSASFVKPLEVR